MQVLAQMPTKFQFERKNLNGFTLFLLSCVSKKLCFWYFAVWGIGTETEETSALNTQIILFIRTSFWCQKFAEIMLFSFHNTKNLKQCFKAALPDIRFSN